jgi:predicted ATPase/DNA-binding SARP family transcriptional activator
MPRLTLSLLGPFQATLDSKPITEFESDRVRALLAYVAVETDRQHRRAGLAGLLWPDWPDRSALTNLRNALSNLRKAIGERKAAVPTLLVDRETIQFNPASDSRVDVQTFRALTAPGQPARSLEEGVGLYRSSFLQGFGLDSAPFEDWVQVVREQLQRQCLAALEQLAEHYEQLGDLSKACDFAWKQVDLAPWQEEAHQRLMRLLALSGQRSAALAQYETCRHLLQQELGVAPSAETVALYERIRNGEIGERRETATFSPGLPRPSSLPVWLTHFVGRQSALAEIHDRLQDPTCRLLTLVGPGGSGKTRLAAEAVARLDNVFPHGVYFVPLAPLQSAEHIVPAVAHAVGFVFHEQEEPRPQLLRYLRSKTMLLVLDNFEHLLGDSEPDREDGVEIVTEMLQLAPGIKVMVTSRAGLNAQGEHILPVPGMSYPEQPPADLSAALEYSAVKLFIQDAQRVRPGFGPTGDDVAHVIQICQLVQGMPLGILLAAAWMRMLSPAEIAAQLAAQKLDFLQVEWHDVPERQRSMRAVFDYSWRLLSERECQVLAGLSVFRGGFTYPAAQQVATTNRAAATLRDLMGLINSSMLQRTRAGRYQMHELLRQYAEEKLRESPEVYQSARDRHAACYMAALREWDTELQGTHQQEALTEMDVEIDNVRAAWSWAAKSGQADRLAEGMQGLGQFCDWRARYKEGEKSFRTVAERLAADGAAQPIEHLKVWGSALAWQARFNQRLGKTETARERAHQSLALLDELTLAGPDVRRERALALQVIGEIELQLGNCQSGKEPLAQSLSLYRALEDRRSIANCLRSAGRLAERMGDYAQAIQLHQEGVALCRELGSRRDTVDAQLDLYVDLVCIGRHQEAERLLQETLALSQESGDRAALTAVRYRLALDLMGSKPAEGLAMLEECVSIFAELGDRHRWALALMRFGEAHMHLGHCDQARASLQESLDWYQAVDNRWGIGAALRLLAQVALVEGQYAEAKQLFRASAVAFRRSGARADIGGAIAGLSMAAAGLGELDQARQNAAEVLRIALEFRHAAAPTYVLGSLALLAAKEGRGERAVELWALASHGHESSSCFYEGLYRQHIEPVAATLTPELVAEAEARGRARDEWAALEELRNEWG